MTQLKKTGQQCGDHYRMYAQRLGFNHIQKWQPENLMRYNGELAFVRAVSARAHWPYHAN